MPALSIPDWAWLAAAILSFFVGAYLVAESERRQWWTRKKKVNVTIMVVFAVWLLVTAAIPATSYGAYIRTVGWDLGDVGGRTVTIRIPPEPAVKYSWEFNFSATGAFSAQNNIHLTAVFFNANITDLQKYYCCIQIAEPSFPALLGSPFVLTNMGNGVYETSGYFTTVGAGPVWVSLAPPREYYNSTIVTSTIEHQIKPVLNVSSASDTLQIDLNEFVIKTGFVFSSFSILVLQPVIEAIVLKDARETDKALRQ